MVAWERDEEGVWWDHCARWEFGTQVVRAARAGSWGEVVLAFLDELNHEAHEADHKPLWAGCCLD